MKYFSFKVFLLLLFTGCYTEKQNSSNLILDNLDTVNYLKVISFNKNHYRVTINEQEPVDYIILENKYNSSIKFPTIINCSDTITFIFHGKVTDLDNNSIEGVKLLLHNVCNDKIYSTNTNSEGNYRLEAIIDRNYTFMVTKEGYYGFEMINFEPFCDEVKNVSIKLCKAN